MRNRGVAVVIKRGKVLLVRHRGRNRLSLPGGGVKRGEPTVSAAARELYQEVGFHSILVECWKDCDFEGSRDYHKVCLIKTTGKAYVKSPDKIEEIAWWDMKKPMPLNPHVKHILNNLL
jgi:8-oxo-dGTP pyrophosphatase MutT (NUDIX family)